MGALNKILSLLMSYLLRNYSMSLSCAYKNEICLILVTLDFIHTDTD